MAERAGGAVSLVIACLCVGAAVLALLVLSGDEDSKAVAAAFTTTVALPFFSLTGAAGLALCRRDSGLALLGALTLVLSVLGLIAIVALALDDDFFFGDTWRPAAYLLIACLTAAHCSLLLADSREQDGDGLRLARAGMVLTVALLATLALIEISGSGQDIGERPLSLIAILYLLSASVFGLLRFNGAGSR
jgi:hypothetical protein